MNDDSLLEEVNKLKINVSDENFKRLEELCHRYKVKRLEFFGSVLRNDFDENSDIDVLVEFYPDAKIGYIDFYSLEKQLSNIFKRKIDLVSKAGLRQKQRRQMVINKREKPMQQDIDILHLTDILENIDAVSQFIDGIQLDDFRRDELRKSAVLQKLVAIGVAASNINLSKYKIYGIEKFRRSGLKAYFSIDAIILWDTAARDLPKLRNRIIRILKEIDH